MSMFGDKKETNPEGAVGVDVEATNPTSLTGEKEYSKDTPPDLSRAVDFNRADAVPDDGKSLQTVVKTTLEDFFSAIERVKAVTVELDKIAIEAESRIRSN